MPSKQNVMFDIPYSLPCNSHSVALATRRVTTGLEQQSVKYMPDYGGVLEVPGSKIKQSGLKRGLPFDPKPSNIRVSTSNDEYNAESNYMRIFDNTPVTNCLITTRIFRFSNDAEHFSSIRALGKNLYLDSVERIFLNDETPYHSVQTLNSKQFAHIPYSYDISGIKIDNYDRNTLIVKFQQGVKLLRLNELFVLPSPRQDCDHDDISEQPAFDFIGSFPSNQSMNVGDACLNTTRNTLGVAFSNAHSFDIKLYDLTRSQRCYRRIQQRLQDDRVASRAFASSIKCDRRSMRSFIPSKPTYETVMQLENDPSHMLNMVLTTSSRVALIDPRSDSIDHLYVDRYKMSPVFPMERYNKIEFSSKNDDQFYLLSNVRLKAMDKRFLSQPMNSIEHMLDINDLDCINMKIVNMKSEKQSLETICLSANGQLCFLSFDQSQMPINENAGCLVNPKSVHAPLLQPSPASITRRFSDELYGLSTTGEPIFDDKEVLFSVAQMTRDGDLWLRGYRQKSQTETIGSVLRNITIYECDPKNDLPPPRSNLVETTCVRKDMAEDSEFINVLQEVSSIETEEKFTSKRALEKFKLMKAKLQRTA